MGKYKIVNYGCQMNVHESEKVAGILDKLEFSATDSMDEADIVVFNTCCIRDTAEQRALGNIGVVKHYKKKKPELIVVVVGCMTQQVGYTEMFKQKYPYVDIVLGTKNINLLPERISEVSKKKTKFRSNSEPENYLEIDEIMPVSRTSFPNAWVNIIYGCNNFCTYCIVPYVRGREISRDIQSIIEEVKACLNEGYKEITLLGQNVNSYGNDRTDGASFARLLSEIDKIEGKFRVRFMTSHPKDLNEKIVDIIAKSQKICKNIHLPAQSGSDKVLKEMNRRYTSSHYLSLVDMIRAKMPNCGITSDIMVGFPTETEADFEDTLNLVKEAEFSTAFTFVYSPRKGTSAAEMNQLPNEIKKKRIMRLVALQNSITKKQSQKYLGNVYEVLVEDKSDKEQGYVCGRTDCGRLVTFKADADTIGDFIMVKINEARSASLFGEIAEGEEK